MAQSVGRFNCFAERDSNNVRLGKIDEILKAKRENRNDECEMEEYRVLKTFKFTSDRKCSSIVVRAPDGLVYVYVKGSELAIKPMLKAGQEAQLKAVETDEENFAHQGLRTLYFGYKVLEPPAVI